MKWGSTTLNVLKDSYIPPYAESEINIIDLIPGTDNTTPSTVMQQGGRQRYEVRFEGLVWSYAAYQALESDYISGTSRTFNDDDTTDITMVITELKPKSRSLAPFRIIYEITLTEV